MKAVALFLVLFSGVAQAQVTIDQMTCAEAKAYALKYKRYWVQTRDDGPVPIYPVKQLEELRCDRKQIITPISERTGDGVRCVLGYYCQSI